MRKIILMTSVSVDGFFEWPGRDISWHLVDEEVHQYINDDLGRKGGFLSRRITHELMAEFAGIWRNMPKSAFSRTRVRVFWQSIDASNEHLAHRMG
jgi:hypothetical protein